MLKRFILSLAILAGLFAPVHAAGTIAFSLSQQLDQFGKPLSGCKFYTIQAATTSTPQNAYQDAALTLALPNPMTCDAAGRLPQFFLADGSIKIRLTDKTGVTQVVADGILVIGPSSGGGGGGGGVDPTTIFATGDTLWSDISSTRTGWVRDNGRTIGSASSGATERANADTEALFNFLWQTYDNTICPVSSGRGVSSAADWAANKTIATPDKRGYIAGGLADMGNSDSLRWANVPVVSGSVTTPGSVIGEATPALARNQLPNVAPSFSGVTGTVSVISDISAGNIPQVAFTTQAGSAGGIYAGSVLARLVSGGTFTPQGVVQSLNGNVTQAVLNNVQKTVLGTFFRKL